MMNDSVLVRCKSLYFAVLGRPVLVYTVKLVQAIPYALSTIDAFNIMSVVKPRKLFCRIMAVYVTLSCERRAGVQSRDRGR